MMTLKTIGSSPVSARQNGAVRFLLILLLCIALPVLSKAAPVVDFPAGNAAWTVEITYADAASGASAPHKVVATRVGDRTRYAVTWADQTVSEVWVIGQYMVMEDPHTHSINALPVDTNITGIGPYDGSLFSWIKESMLVKSDPWQGKPSVCYRGPAAVGSASGNRQAWIDQETRRPLALDDGTRTYSFTFQAAPAQLPPVPPSLESALKLYVNSFQSAPAPLGRSR